MLLAQILEALLKLLCTFESFPPPQHHGLLSIRKEIKYPAKVICAYSRYSSQFLGVTKMRYFIKNYFEVYNRCMGSVTITGCFQQFMVGSAQLSVAGQSSSKTMLSMMNHTV